MKTILKLIENIYTNDDKKFRLIKLSNKVLNN